MNLASTNIKLRALEPADLNYLYRLENDANVWEVSQTLTPYSKFVLKQYLDNAHKDIFEAKQLRLVIELIEGDKPIGFVDLFDFNPKHRRAGVGIIIFSEEHRGRGYASEVLEVLINYAQNILDLHQLFANISEANKASIQLFEKCDFELSGVKKDWIFSEGNYKNELLYQLLLKP